MNPSVVNVIIDEMINYDILVRHDDDTMVRLSDRFSDVLHTTITVVDDPDQAIALAIMYFMKHMEIDQIQEYCTVIWALINSQDVK